MQKLERIVRRLMQCVSATVEETKEGYNLLGPVPTGRAPGPLRALVWGLWAALSGTLFVLARPRGPGLLIFALASLGLCWAALRLAGRRRACRVRIDLASAEIHSGPRRWPFAAVTGSALRAEDGGAYSLWLVSESDPRPLFLAHGEEAALLALNDRVLRDVQGGRRRADAAGRVEPPDSAASRFPRLAPPVIA